MSIQGEINRITDEVAAQTTQINALIQQANNLPDAGGSGTDLALGITGATVGQIAKITAVDVDGKPTAWTPVDMPSGNVRWQTINSLTLTEQTNTITITKDANGVDVADYNAIALKVEFDVPADSTQGSNSGTPWIYPGATMDNSFRAIGNIAGWKTINRRSIIVFTGNIDGMVATGNVETQLVPTQDAKPSLTVMDGVRLFLNNTSDHWPAGTTVSLEVLSGRD